MVTSYLHLQPGLQPRHTLCVCICLVGAAGFYHPTLEQVWHLGQALACAWLRHSVLQHVANRMSTTPLEYDLRLADGLWGGILDFIVCVQHTGQHLTAQAHDGSVLWSSKPAASESASATLLRHQQHYSVLRATPRLRRSIDQRAFKKLTWNFKAT